MSVFLGITSVFFLLRRGFSHRLSLELMPAGAVNGPAGGRAGDGVVSDGGVPPAHRKPIYGGNGMFLTGFVFRFFPGMFFRCIVTDLVNGSRTARDYRETGRRETAL